MAMEKAKTEVLRYLGWRGQEIPPEIDSIIAECLLLMREAATPRHVAATFDIRAGKDGIAVQNTGLCLRGFDICRHLAGCGQIVLMAVTLGIMADNLIRVRQATDVTGSLILDACATQLTEQYCDGLEEQIRRDAASDGMMTAPRFSPGYGDLPLDIQPGIISVLDAGKRIGLTCTENFIMLPRKSVTAIIGMGSDLSAKPAGCGACLLNETCSFKKGKDNDGYTADDR